MQSSPSRINFCPSPNSEPTRSPSPPYELGCDWDGFSPPPSSWFCEDCQPNGMWPRICSRFNFKADDLDMWITAHDVCLNWQFCDGCRPNGIWPRTCPDIFGHLGAKCPVEFSFHHEWSKGLEDS